MPLSALPSECLGQVAVRALIHEYYHNIIFIIIMVLLHEYSYHFLPFSFSVPPFPPSSSQLLLYCALPASVASPPSFVSESCCSREQVTSPVVTSGWMAVAWHQ